MKDAGGKPYDGKLSRTVWRAVFWPLLYILSSSQIKSFFGTSGGLKYFLLGGLSSGFILLGASLLYGYTGALNFDDIFKIYSDTSTNYFIDPCLLILFAGLLFKVSAVPFHNWAPDVYNQVPTISTTWLIVIAKISIFILMLILVHQIRIALDLNSLSNIQQLYSVDNHKLFDFYAITTIFDDININFKSLFNFSDSFISGEVLFHKNYEFPEAEVPPFLLPNYSSIGIWTNILTLSAIFSLLIGTFVGVTQSSVKRLYSYSTISHVGFLLLALSVNSLSSLDAFLFYLIQYTITNLNLFFILIAWGYIYVRYFKESNREFKAIRFIKVNPISLKDVYFDPTIFDLIESVNQDLSEFNKENKLYLKNELFKINTMEDYYFTHELEKHSNIYNNYKEWIYTPVPYIVNFKGMFKSDPMLAFCLAITLLSLTGIPPLIGFYGKQQVLLASMQAGFYLGPLVAIFTSVIGASYYLRIIKFLYFCDNFLVPIYNDRNGINKIFHHFKNTFTLEDNDSNYNIPLIPSNHLSLAIALLTCITLFFIIKPFLLLNIINLITLSLY